MKARVSTQVVAAIVVTMIGFGAGCGDGSNNDNGGPVPTGATRTRTPTTAVTPTRTATPASGGVTLTPTPLPSGSTKAVTITASSSASILGFDLRIAYPTAKGSFTGSADSVACNTTAPGFTKNDLDNGTLILIVANTGNLTFPVVVNCTFDDTSGNLASTDITATIREITVLENGQATGKTDAGNTSQVTVAVAVTS